MGASGDVEMHDAEAVKVLGDRSAVFKDNEAFASGVQSAGAGEGQATTKYVAIKKVKMNDFNVRINQHFEKYLMLKNS